MKKSFLLFLIIIVCFLELIFSSALRDLAQTSVYAQAGHTPNPPKMAISSSNSNIVIALATSESQIFINWFSSPGASLKSSYLCTNGCNYPSVAQSNLGGSCLIYFDSIAGQIIANKYDGSQNLQKTLGWSVTPTSTCATSISNGSYVLCWISTSGNISFVIADYTLTNVNSQVSIAATSNSKISTSSLSNGNFILIWSMNSNIYAAIYNSSGSSVVRSFQVNPSATANTYSHFVTGLSNGNFVIVWDSYITGTLKVHAKLFSNAGINNFNTFTVNDLQYNGFHNPTVAETLNGGFVVAWQNYMKKQGWDIYYKEFDSTGSPVSGENIGSTVTTGDQSFPIVVNHPSLRYLISYISAGTTVYLNQANEELFHFGRSLSECCDWHWWGTCASRASGTIANCASFLCNGSCEYCYNYFYTTQGGGCVSSCPAGQYGDSTSWSCSVCSSLCLSCIDATRCTSCNSGYFLNPLNGQCVTTCPDEYYGNTITSTCQQCPLNCKNCSDANTCFFCNISYFLYLLDNKCYNPCPIDYYGNTNTNQCHSCSNNCTNCINENICSICALNFYLHYLVDNKCYSICPDNYYANTVKNTCESCSGDCKHCGDEKTCTECVFNYFLFYFYCYSNCPFSFYNDVPTKSCIACTSSCKTCINPNACISCIPGYFLLPNLTCNSKCPIGYFASASTGKCVGCPKNCNLCVSANQCNQCIEGFYLNLQNNLCYNPCPDGFFGNDDINTCDACQANCKKCENGTQCLLCLDSYYLNPLDMSCVNTCPDFYFPNQLKKACSGCPSNCVHCQNEIDCNICLTNYFLFLQTNQCYSQCPDGFYSDSISTQCKQCNILCKTCSGPNEAHCYICALPYTKAGDKCIISCPGVSIYDASSLSCVPLNKFISNFSIQGPGNVDIEIVPSFNITVILERNTLFKNIPLNIQLVWDNIYGGNLMNNNQTLTLYPQSLTQGIYDFTVNLIILDNPINSINVDVNLRTYHLIPIVKNVTAFQIKQPIILDASQSYDERDIGSFVINLQPMEFQWICPGELEAVCSSINTAMLMLTYDDYKEYVEVNGLLFPITLELIRDVKSNSLNYPITLNEIQNTDNANFWYITQKIYNGDVIFSVVLLNTTDSNYKLEDFEYYWTIPNFNVNNYLNTRGETNLRIGFSDINNLIDSVTCQLTEIATQLQYTKDYQFQSTNLPFGKCQVNPPSGMSGSTPFMITVSDMISENQPLQFAFYYENYFGIEYNLKAFYTQSFISLLPYGTNFYLMVTDRKGYVSKIDCPIQIQINSDLNNLSNQFFSILDIFAENEIYYSNMNSQYATGYTNFNFLNSVNFISNLFNTNQYTLIDSNMEKIISFINILNSCKSDLQINSNIILLNDLLESISLNLNIISSDLVLITKYANAADDNLQRYYSNQANAQNVAFLKQYDNIWNNIITSIYSSLISGQDVAIVTDYNRVTLSIISKINLSSIKLMTNNNDGLFIFRVTHLSNENSGSSSTTSPSNDCGYDLESDVCIERSEILNKLSSNNFSKIGVFIKVNNFPFVPYESSNSYLFSMNTIKVSLLTDGSGVLSRLLSQSAGALFTQNIKYQAYLNLVPLGTSQFTHAIPLTTCVAYDSNYNINATACNSWYDNFAKVSLCVCSGTGNIANLYDQTLAELNRATQFPPLQYSIFNKYSLSIILSLIIVVGSLYLLASLQDISEGYTKRHIVKKYYDLGQRLIIDYTKLGFDKNYGLLKLFLYMVKMTHPLLSIFYIYSTKYSRGLRVLDLYIQIKITFIFSLLPYYFTDNSDFTAIKKARSVANIGESPGALSVAFSRILWSLVYSVSGIICAKIIIGFLNAIYYKNILQSESHRKYKYILKTIKRTYTDDVFVYSNRCRNASIKMKTLISLRERLRDLHNLSNSKKSLEVQSLINSHLDLASQGSKFLNSNVDEIMSPKPIYDINKTLNLESFDSSNTMKILKVNSMLFPRQYFNHKNKISTFVSTQSEYDYIISENKKNASVSFTTLQIIDEECLNEENRIEKKRSLLKTRLFILLFISSYIFLVIMITNVYNKYQDNIFKICITPLLSVVLIRFIVTQNVMIFVYSLIMYLFGEKYYNDNRKSSNPLSLVFKYVIPPVAKSNHKALLAYIKLNNNLERKNEF